MKHIYFMVAVLCCWSVLQAQNKAKTNIKNKGTITITENGVTKHYVFDVDTNLLRKGTNLNELLESLDVSFDTGDSASSVTPIRDENPSIEITGSEPAKIVAANKGRVVVESNNKTEVVLGNKERIKIEESEDTVTVRIGGKVMRVVENNDGSVISFDENENSESKDWQWTKHKNKKKFKGHYGLLELGLNTYTNPDYTAYSETSDDPRMDNFMDLNHNRSTEFNLNVFWKGFGLQKNKENIGIVTGLGFSWNNYFFAKDITLDQGDQFIEPVFTEDDPYYGYVNKTKLMAAYLTLPLLFEFQAQTGNQPLYAQIGAIGGLKLGSHTKIVHGGNKDKDFSDFYLVPFKYGATARIGYGSIYIYGNYWASELFKTDRGPKMNPYTIGIGFPAF